MVDYYIDKIGCFPSENIFRQHISRVALSLETRITIDFLKGNYGAKLVNQQGKAIDVHPTTIERYQELCSLIDAYTKSYEEKLEFKVLKDKWNYPQSD